MKPIKPDRVRIPKEWWHARIVWLGTAGLYVAVFIIGDLLFFYPRGIRLDGWMSFGFFVMAFCVSPLYGVFVHRAWVKRIREHDGIMCPQCAYPLTGCPEEEGGVACPECGYITQDTSQLFERWRTSLNRFFWGYNKNIRSHRNKQPND